MAKRTKTKKPTKSKLKKNSYELSNQQKLVLGSFFVIIGVALFISFVSFFFTGKADQSTLNDFIYKDVEAQNWLSKLGAWLSDFFIHRGFGVSAFIIAFLFMLSGIYVIINQKKTELFKHWFWGLYLIIWFSIFFGFFSKNYGILGGTIGFEINAFLAVYIGATGTILLLLLGLITYLAI